MALAGLQRIRAALATRPLLVAAIILPASVFVAAAAFDFRSERQQVRGEVLATSSALAEHAQTVVETTDLVLARVLDRVARMGWSEIGSSRDLHDFLQGLKQGLPQIESVFLVDPDGRYVATSRAFPLGTVPTVADRDYFQAAKAGNMGVFVSTPFIGQLNNRYAFTFTQPRMRDGQFDGLVGVTISPAYFQQFYSQAIEFPGQAAATLLRDDGVVMIRYPAVGGAPIRLPAESVFMRAIASDGLTGLYSGRSSLDGRLRIGAYRRLRNQPLFIGYSVNDQAYLAPWRANLVFIGGFSAMLAAALLVTERVQRRRAVAEAQAAAALLQEVDRRRKAELALEQMQKMEALGRLSGGVAHDFNNLLTAILGPLELAAKRTTDARLLRLLGGAMQAAQRGAKLTAQMLAVARTRDASAVTLDPNALIRDLGEMIGRTIGPMITLTYDLDAAATPVSAETIQLEMTLLNLCVNARDAMPEGGKLVLRTRAVRHAAAHGRAAGDYVEISVTDTGEGMSAETRARAFEPFFTTKEPGKGTGLGLSTTYGFAQSAGGTVSIASEPGHGTTVTLLLPLVAGEPAVMAKPEAAAPGRTYRILLVDDDPAVRMTTRDLLDEAGHDVVEAANGPAALEQLRSGTAFDLMTTDFAMPGMDGAQLAAAARALVPDLPILFVTGYAKGDALAAWEHGGARVLDKPFTGAQLARAVQETVAATARAA